MSTSDLAELTHDAESQNGGSDRPMVDVIVVHGQLTHGGSERQLHLALAQAAADRIRVHLVIAGELGLWERPIRDLGITVTLLEGSPARKLADFRKLCRQRAADLVLSWSSYTNVYALTLRGTGIPVIGSFRNAAFTDLPERGRLAWAWASRAGLDLMIANSEETRRSLVASARSGTDIVYIPNAVDTVTDQDGHRAHWRDELGIARDELLVLGMGRLAPQKNFSRFIQAVARAHREQAPTEPTLRGVIVGPDMGLGGELEAEIERADLPPDTIRLHGPVPDGREILCAADLFVLSSDHEGMPNVVLEAMAASVPVITTRVNGLSGCLDHGVEGLITDHDAEQMGDAIARLASEDQLRAEMGKAGRARINAEFDPGVVYRELWRLCRILSGSA